MSEHSRDTLERCGMKPKAVRRYDAMRANIDRGLRRIAALSGVLGGLEQTPAGRVDSDDIAFVAAMIREDAYDILERLNDFAAPADLDADPTPE